MESGLTFGALRAPTGLSGFRFHRGWSKCRTGLIDVGGWGVGSSDFWKMPLGWGWGVGSSDFRPAPEKGPPPPSINFPSGFPGHGSAHIRNRLQFSRRAGRPAGRSWQMGRPAASGRQSQASQPLSQPPKSGNHYKTLWKWGFSARVARQDPPYESIKI